ncbi:Retinol dehydrogenase 13 [Toxocara canis]|uniref:Retinol dehydrogenase 13 n=1 Tax=Toxocara canis TaxID=6265 RepID=A0A0B2VYR2_TOXCA|nr:Retinol dehydrogenase 13 [Toxocara canis]
MRRLIRGITSPWSLGFSAFGLAYGAYHIWDMTQSGSKYDLDEDLTGKTYIVTGATSGIGQMTTEELAKRNARVIMACRNRDKCVKVRRDIVLNTRNKQVYCRQCNLEDFDSIRAFVAKLSQGKFELDRIDGIVYNAATMEPERLVNKEGIEKTLATNYLGYFLLTALLLDKILAQPNPVRLVFLNTNIIERNCAIDFDDLNAEHRKKWDGFKVYKESKLAQAMFAKELSERLKDTNITVAVADPGRTKTSLSKKMDGQTFFLSRWLLNIVGFAMGQRRVEKAVRPVLFALADKEMEFANGVFIDRERNEQKWADAVLDKASRERLWMTSVKWTKLSEHLAALRSEIQQGASSLGTALSVQKATQNVSDSSTGRWWTLWLW